MASDRPTRSPLWDENGVDIRLVSLVIASLALFALVGGMVGTEVPWQRWFFGALALFLGSVMAFFAVRLARR